MSRVPTTGGTTMPSDAPPAYANTVPNYAGPPAAAPNYAGPPAAAPPTNNTYSQYPVQQQYQPQPSMQQTYQPQPPMQQQYQPQPPMQQTYQPQPPMQQTYQPQSNMAGNIQTPASENGPKKYGCARLGVWVLIGFLVFVTFLEFCALCTSNKLTKSENNGITTYCGWDEYRVEMAGHEQSIKFKDCADSIEDCEDNESAGSTFIAFGVLSFFTLLGMFASIISIDCCAQCCNNCCCSLWVGNLVTSVIVSIMMIISWGTWVNKNTCMDGDGAKHGDGLNLMIAAWFFLTFFYLPLSIPAVQKLCFGPQACDA